MLIGDFLKIADGYIRTSRTQNFEDFLISVAIGQTEPNLYPLLSRDLYEIGMDRYELPTLVLYPIDIEAETKSGKANGFQMTVDLGKKLEILKKCNEN